MVQSVKKDVVFLTVNNDYLTNEKDKHALLNVLNKLNVKPCLDFKIAQSLFDYDKSDGQIGSESDRKKLNDSTLIKTNQFLNKQEFTLLFDVCKRVFKKDYSLYEQSHVQRMFEREISCLIKNIEHKIKQIEQEGFKWTPEKLLLHCSQIDTLMAYVQHECEVISKLHESVSLRQYASLKEQHIKNIKNNYYLSEVVFCLLKSINTSKLSLEDKNYVDNKLLKMKRLGVDQKPKIKIEIAQTKARLNELEEQFLNHIRTDQRTLTLSIADCVGLSAAWIKKRTVLGTHTVVINYADYSYVVTNALLETTRQRAYSYMMHRADPKNRAVLIDLLNTRQRLASLLFNGTPDSKDPEHTYAQLRLESATFKSAKRVFFLLQRVHEMIQGKSRLNLSVLLKEKNKEESAQGQPISNELFPWDRRRFLKQAMKQKFGVNEEDFKPYFPYERTLEQILKMLEKFYGVNFKKVERDSRMHADARAYQVLKDGRVIGFLTLDLLLRQGKIEDTAHLERMRMQGQSVIPHAVVTASWDAQTPILLLSLSQVEDILHELGHAMHHVIGSAGKKYITQSGLYSVSRDFVEIPSEFLSSWALSSEFIKSATHYQTGAPVPALWVEQIKQARRYFRPLDLHVQVYLALSLLGMHTGFLNVNPLDIDAFVSKQYHPFNYHPDSMYASMLSVSHVVDYGPTYYTYVLAEVLKQVLLLPFERYGMMNPFVTQAYVETVVAPKERKNGLERVQDFLKHTMDLEFVNEDAFVQFIAGVLKNSWSEEPISASGN